MLATNSKCRVKLVFVVSVLSVVITAQGEEMGDFQELTLEISTGKRKVLPLEAIEISIALSNDTDKPIKGEPVINPGAGLLKIYIAGRNQPFEEFRSTGWPLVSVFSKPIVMHPGFRRSVSGYLYYEHPANPDKELHGRYIIEAPGIYRIMAKLKEVRSEGRIESNVLTIEAKKPKGQDAAAYEYLRSLRDIKDKDVYYGSFLMRSFGRGVRHVREQKVLDRKEEFLLRFAKSRYARYVRYSLGRTYRREKEEEQYQRGIKLLEKAASYKDFFLAKEALLVLIRDAIKRGETDRAKKYKVMFARRYPNAEEGRDYVEEMYRAPAYWWSFVWPWPLILIGVVAGVFFFVLVPLLKKKASSGSK